MSDFKPPINSWILSADPYPVGKTFEEVAQQYGLKESQILRLAGNESTLGPSPRAIKAAQKELERSNYYGEPFTETLTRKLEAKFAASGLDLNQAGIVVGNGMDSVLDHLASLLLGPEASIVNTPPTFVYYDAIAKRSGAEIINVQRKNTVDAAFTLDVEDILKAIKPNTRIIFACTPNNPTGNSLSRNEIGYLAAETLKRNVYLFIDEAYIEFSRHLSVYDLVNRYPNLIIGRTFSKAYALAGYRVGYAIMPRNLLKEYQKIMTPFLVARASMAAAIAALDDTNHLDKVIKTAIRGREQLEKALRELKLEQYPSDANFILFKTAKPAAELIDGLAARGIIIRAQKHVCNRTLRVTVGTEAENKRFIKALKECIQ